MSTIQVTNANDSGPGSLRDAVASAGNGDTIDLSAVGTTIIRLNTPLAIGKNVTVNGENSTAYDLTHIDGGVVVQSGADVTLEHLDLSSSVSGQAATANAQAGADGMNGPDGLPGAKGGDGDPGGDATSSTGGATNAGPALENDGSLNLVLSQVRGTATNVANSGKGADGADGGNGGDGGRGAPVVGNGVAGGIGGDGGNGSNGTNGGDEVGGVINTGHLTIQDSVITGQAVAGDGGAGGNGGGGGTGGLGGDSITPPGGGSAIGGRGGNGGSGGNGGNGGDGGSAVGGIVNTGTVNIVGAGVLYGDSAQAGAGGAAGGAGLAGVAGSGGANGGSGRGPNGMDGNDGTGGASGVFGTQTVDYLDKGTTTGSFTVNHYFYDFVTQDTGQPSTVSVGGGANPPVGFSYTVGEFGGSVNGFPDAGSVGWKVVTSTNGPLPADFVGPTSGMLTYDALQAGDFLSKSFSVQLKGDAAAPANETFNVQIFDPATGDVLGSIDSLTQNVTNLEAPVCFGSGTLISTARGDVAVEVLRIGDKAVTASGALRPIVWIGHRVVECKALPVPSESWPVRIRAGAFGDGLPTRDLYLSPGHPVLVGSGANQVLVPIMCLINGTSIARVPVDQVTYWHIEIDRHDILLAEGLPAESFLDYGNRPWFENVADHALTNPDFIPPGLDGRCRPVAIDGPIVEIERRRLDLQFQADLSTQCGWPAADAPSPLF